jgi:hypothetical protein
LTSEKQGKVEIVFYTQDQKVPLALANLGAEAKVSGDMVNAVLPEGQQEAALDVLRRERLRLISLTPVRSSLEEYYVQKLRPAETPGEVVAAEAQPVGNRKGAGV